MRPRDAGHIAPAAHGLPSLCPLPLRTADENELPVQQADEPISQPVLLPASKGESTSTQTASSLWREARALEGLRRIDELADEYPLKLIRELDRISSEPPVLNQEKLEFKVIHVHDSAYKGLISEYLGTYTTARAANDRVLDFWDHMYGAKMFTDVPLCDDCNKIYERNEFFKDAESHSSRISPATTPNDGSLGGVEANNSHWAIADQCLTLSHSSHEEEKKVYAVVSCLRDQGTHS